MRRKSHFRFLFLLIPAIVFPIAGCSKTSHKTVVENERKNIITAEQTNKRKVDFSLPNIQSVELFTFKAQPIYSLRKSFTEAPRTSFNSQINTMYDGFGNKTEIRCLDNDPVLKCITLKTSALGQRQAIVFGNHGEIKRLPDKLLDRAMTADASDIASAVGIFEVPKANLLMSETTTNEEIESYNNPVPTPSPTPEILTAEPTVQPIETVKAETTPELKSPEVRKDPTPQIKIDSLWLNNYPLKKKTSQP